MGEDSLKGYIFGFVLMTLFGLLILTAVVSVASNYSKDTSEVVGGSLALANFSSSVNSIETRAKTAESAFNKQGIFSVAGIVVSGIFGIAIDLVKMITMPFALISNIAIDIFHVPSFFMPVILGLLIISILFGIWSLIKVGQ